MKTGVEHHGGEGGEVINQPELWGKTPTKISYWLIVMLNFRASSNEMSASLTSELLNHEL